MDGEQPQSWAARYLEGWQVGAIVVLLVVSVIPVIVPRTAVPEGLPAPRVTPEELQSSRARNRRAVQEALAAELAPMVRLTGARIRKLGRLEWDRATDRVTENARREITESRLAVDRRHGPDLVLLRDYQAQLFSVAYCDFLRTGTVSDDLVELGGSAVLEFHDNGWLDALDTAPADTDLILSAISKRRFARLSGLPPSVLPPDPVEERALIGYLIGHPPRLPQYASADDEAAVNGRFLMKQIDSLGALEPNYPVAYAKGIVFFRMGQFEASAVSFDAYLQQVGNGPYRMRAVNYLKAAVERTEGLP